MSETLTLIHSLVAQRNIRVSAHGLRELGEDRILFEELAAGVDAAVVVEDYPGAFKGPSVLVLQRDAQGRPVHVLWGLEAETSSPAVLITAYRPDAGK